MSLAEQGRLPDWEAFYRDYRKPGYVPGFEITTKLGGGMFGLVFRARRMSIGKDYAIKFLQVDDGEVRKAVLSELEQVKWFAQIDHPNLVSIEDRGEVDGIPFLVMAFAGTETLRDKMTGVVPGGETKDELLRFFLQACRGLAALHERSLVHFDIKPANVFLKGAVARLGDYGLSKLVTHSRGSLSMGRGTPYYMAPEMLQRRGDHRSDIYSLGVMLYELLCGKVPFTGDSEWEVLKKHETETPAMPVHLTAREQAILQRCLQKDPAARFASVHDLVAAFGAGGVEGVGVAGVGSAPAGAMPPASPVALGDCMPTSPPLVVPTGEPTAKRARRATPPPLPSRARTVVVTVAVGMAAAMAVLVMFTVSRERPSLGAARAAVSPSPSMPAPMAAPNARRSAGGPATAPTAAAKLEQFVANLQKSTRSAVQRQRRTTLRPLDEKQFAVPPDFRLYHEQVKELGKAPYFSEGKAQKLERLGRFGFVAGVAMLQKYDYDDEDDCARATNIVMYLMQMTGVAGLEAAMSGPELSEIDTCRYLAVADSWRRLADQYARSETAFQQLTATKARSGSSR